MRGSSTARTENGSGRRGLAPTQDVRRMHLLSLRQLQRLQQRSAAFSQSRIYTYQLVPPAGGSAGRRLRAGRGRSLLEVRRTVCNRANK